MQSFVVDVDRKLVLVLCDKPPNLEGFMYSYLSARTGMSKGYFCRKLESKTWSPARKGSPPITPLVIEPGACTEYEF